MLCRAAWAAAWAMADKSITPFLLADRLELTLVEARKILDLLVKSRFADVSEAGYHLRGNKPPPPPEALRTKVPSKAANRRGKDGKTGAVTHKPIAQDVWGRPR